MAMQPIMAVLLAAGLALAAANPASADDKLQKVTIAFAGKGMSFIML